MLPITVYNQKGGTSKSTITRDLAATYDELGLDVLVVDFDSQRASISYYLGMDEDKRDPDADDITLHLIDQPKSDFDDLIRPVTENIDLLPSHKRFGEVGDYLNNHEDYLAPTKPDNWEYPRYQRFYQVLKENDIQDQYDVMLVDPNAKSDEAYYLALYATRNLIIPAETTQAGYDSIEAVKHSGENFAEAHDISIKLLTAVPTESEPHNKSIHQEYLTRIEEEYPTAVYFKDIGAYQKAEAADTTLFDYLKNCSRIRSYQEQLMPKYRTLAAIVYQRSGREIPDGVWERDDLFFGDDYWTVNESALPTTLQVEAAETSDDATVEVA